ncbi:hypothetical protein [Ornithinimicrobium kibberense]|uniref:hypothetical protein n=1 Tax=Ornithinimicrobium kibberense TaxID=282060 RepID=UPI003605F068
MRVRVPSPALRSPVVQAIWALMSPLRAAVRETGGSSLEAPLTCGFFACAVHLWMGRPHR